MHNNWNLRGLNDCVYKQSVWHPVRPLKANGTINLTAKQFSL